MNHKQREIQISLKHRLAKDTPFALSALSMLYNRQTYLEKIAQCSSSYNGMGFTKLDADFLSSLAEQYNNWHRLSPKQIAALHRLLPKYWRQVMEDMATQPDPKPSPPPPAVEEALFEENGALRVGPTPTLQGPVPKV